MGRSALAVGREDGVAPWFVTRQVLRDGEGVHSGASSSASAAARVEPSGLGFRDDAVDLMKDGRDEIEFASHVASIQDPKVWARRGHHTPSRSGSSPRASWS